jgi:hypothetical protein
MQIEITGNISVLVDVPDDELENMTDDEIMDVFCNEVSVGNMDIVDLDWSVI